MKTWIAFVVILFSSTGAKADIWGADVGVLMQILFNAQQQLTQLQSILKSGSDTLDLMRDINRGINDSLNMLRTADPNVDPGIYGDWRSSEYSLRRVQEIYGNVGDNPDAQVQRDADRSVAEAITYSNDLYRWTRDLDELSEQIKSASHSVSPGGANKLTAESMGVLIQAVNQDLRAQALNMKVNSLALANQNKKNKDESEKFLDANRALQKSMRAEKVRFEVPRF